MVWYGGEGGGLVKTSNIAQSGLQGDCGLHGVSIEQREVGEVTGCFRGRNPPTSGT